VGVALTGLLENNNDHPNPHPQGRKSRPDSTEKRDAWGC